MFWPVHPRVCGEQESDCCYLLTVHPRVCGEQDAILRRSRIAVHPRVCGEQDQPVVHDESLTPVHPRVCGEQARRISRFMLANSHDPRDPVHPRVCGEQAMMPRPCVSTARFIPACAGNRMSPSMASSGVRFIPACAGNRCGFVNRFAAEQIMRSHHGSSPRVRGTAWSPPPSSWRRFIPACAGNSQCDSRRLCRDRFIPACAGNSRRYRRTSSGSWTGSSPRVRGTGHSHASTTQAAVHPRVCGEQSARRCFQQLTGSSPRVRGTGVHWHIAHHGSSPRVRGTECDGSLP